MSDLFVFINGALYCLRSFRIAASLVDADGTVDIYSLCLIFEDTPKEMLIIRTNLVLRSVETLLKILLRVADSLVAGNVAVAYKGSYLR